MRSPVVLCVDDAEEILGFYQNLLGKYGYSVTVAVDGIKALQLFQSTAPQVDAVILDFHMPGMNGLELAMALKTLEPDLPILMVSGDGPKLEEMSPFVDAAISKGVSLHDVARQLDLLLEERTAHDQMVS